MSRKDYVAIAEIIKRSLHPEGARSPHAAAIDQSKWIAGELADLMARDNPRFDAARFLAACGLREGD